MAKQFVFRAEAALELRRREEELAQRELAAASERERQAREARDAAVARVESAKKSAAEAEARAGDMTERLWHRNWILAQHQHAGRSQRALDQRQQDVREAAARAVEAHRKRKALDRLKQRAWQLWSRAVEREEQKSIDELATSKHARENRGGGP